jgi:hypothetical protein
MRFSRRELAGLAAVSIAVPPRITKAQEAVQPDPVTAVRDSVQRNSETLSKFEVPFATEPAFQFKP